MTSFARRLLLALLTLAVSAPAGLAQEDREGCEDHPLLSRMRGFYIERCKEERFSRHEFQTSEGKVPVEGRLSLLVYRLPDDSEKSTDLEIIRNYTNAVAGIGGEVTYEGRWSASMKAMVGDREVWVEVKPSLGRTYQLYVLEKQLMQQQVVADAAALLADLERVGHAVLHGVLFDTDQATIKPESKAALAEIAKLLREHPRMTAFVVGHTDMFGDLEHNLDLSNRRATAVVETLAADYGVSRQRLEARGVGPFAPVGSNDTEAGRASNRRVELVKR